jgi:hypothetical protein
MIIEAYRDFVRVKHVVSMRQVNPNKAKKPTTPWGYPALGRRTRKRKKYSDSFILRRRK